MKKLLVLCFLFLAGVVNASAETYPSRMVRIVVPFGPGTTDLLARLVSARLAEIWAQPVIVDNRRGAGGNIGAEYVAKSAADGYTILFGAASVLAINPSLYPSMPYDAATAFAPITQMATVTNVLVIDPALPFKSVTDLISYAKHNPGKLNYASAGSGGTQHLSAELFKHVTGTDIVHVPYNSAPAAHTDLIAGRVHMFFDGLPSVLPLINSGRLRALGVTSARRSKLLPDVPTIAEAGFPEFDVVGWFGFAAPAKTPKVIVDQINREIVSTLAAPAMKDSLLKLGAEAVGDTPEQFSAFIKAEAARWHKVIKSAGVKVD